MIATEVESIGERIDAAEQIEDVTPIGEFPVLPAPAQADQPWEVIDPDFQPEPLPEWLEAASSRG